MKNDRKTGPNNHKTANDIFTAYMLLYSVFCVNEKVAFILYVYMFIHHEGSKIQY